MEAIATQKYVRSTPKKLRIVTAMTKGLSPQQAVEMLPYSGKKAGSILEKVIRSAIANAKQIGMDEMKLGIKEIQISEGPRLKRGMPVSKGRWHPILKRWSHVRVVLTDELKPKTLKRNSQAENDSKMDKKAKTEKNEKKIIKKKGKKK